MNDLNERIRKLEQAINRVSYLMVFVEAVVIGQCFVILKWVILK